MSQKNRTPITFWYNSNKLCLIIITISGENRQKVLNIVVCYRLTIFHKTGYHRTSLGYFHGNQRAPFIGLNCIRQQTTLVEEIGLSKEDRILIKNLYEGKGYEAKGLMKEFPTKEWKKTTFNDFLKHLRQNRFWFVGVLQCSCLYCWWHRKTSAGTLFLKFLAK